MYTRLSVVVVMGVVLWGLSTAGPALADEFDVAIVMGDDIDQSDFMDGFQLAVDASPDVSHPPDSEGGDHLGSMDVTMVPMDVRSENVTSDAAAVADVGSPIVVVDMPNEGIDEFVAGVAPSGAMIIAFTDVVPLGPSASEGLLVIARHQAEAMAPLLSPSFAAAHDRPPSPAAVRGYTAGKLVDIAVEETDRDPTDIATLQAALASVTRMQGTTAITPTTTLPSTTTRPSSTNSTMSAPGQGATWSIPPGLIALVAVVALIVGVRYFRESRRSTSGDSN